MTLTPSTTPAGLEIHGTAEELYGRAGLPFVPAIRVPAGMDLVFVAGCLGERDAADDSIEAETRRLFERMAQVLDASGATFADVVQVQKILVDIDRDNAAVVAVMREYFPTLPTSMTCQVSRLVPPHLRLEISAIAAVPPRAQA
ncbi:RidA family protein [Blastococcus sp. SYSU D00820]